MLQLPIIRALTLVLVTIVLPSPADVWGHGAGGHGGSSTRNESQQTSSSQQVSKPRRPFVTTNLADRPMQPPHGGQVTASKHHYFEVVYTPSETRLYIYNASRRGINARFVRGEVYLSVCSSRQSLRFPLQVVAQPAFTGDVGYLAAKVDVSQVRDGDMEVRFEIKGLLDEEPEASFSQFFFLTRPLLPVQRANLFADDRQPVVRQGICPVTETRLGDHGDPIKLIVGDRPVYVCCEDCIQRVQNDPHGYIQKASHMVQVNSVGRRPNSPSGPRRPHVTRAQLTAADRPFVQQQRMCPVMDEPLGDHGDPIKLMIDGRPLYVCCEGCVGEVEQKPYFFINKLAEMHPAAPVADNHTGHNHTEHSSPRQEQDRSRLPTLSRPPAYQGNAGRPLAPMVLVAKTTASDAAAIRAQGTCPVTKGSLGSMGTPIKLLVDGKPLFVCCQGCIDKVKRDPMSYVSRSTHMQPVNRYSQQDAWFYEKPAVSNKPALGGGGSGGSCCSSGDSAGASCH